MKVDNEDKKMGSGRKENASSRRDLTEGNIPVIPEQLSRAQDNIRALRSSEVARIHNIEGISADIVLFKH